VLVLLFGKAPKGDRRSADKVNEIVAALAERDSRREPRAPIVGGVVPDDDAAVLALSASYCAT
jgi:hypothetical protein